MADTVTTGTAVSGEGESTSSPSATLRTGRDRRGRGRRIAERSRFGLRDLGAEALAGILQRPGRSVLTMLGTVLGIGAFVTILGLTATAAGQIDKRFTVLSATEVGVDDTGTAHGQGQQPDPAISFTPDAGARVEALHGVVHAGVYWPVPLRSPRLGAAPDLQSGAAGDGSGLAVYAADPGALAAMHPTLTAGTLYNAFHEGRQERVAVLGAAAASRLGITRLDAEPAVFVDGTAYTVVGIIGDVQRHQEMLLSVMIPTSTALAGYGPPGEPSRAKMLIETKLGAAQLIAHQAPIVLRPDDPTLLTAIAPPDPKSLRNDVTGDFNTLFLLLAALSLVIGAVGIANTTLVAVLERTGEIGLRRSLGARPRHIAGQFLAESTVLGTLGGLLGTSVGVGLVVGVALTRDWTAVLQPWAVLPAPLIGSVVGLLAGLYPALRAAWIEPVEALRR
ncbi:ABC transporter permease [Catenulispora subtropica]|uniref:ABC transporter permease n=1 Tax=Catenulispora subtropica TaxID=450798 RepID=A0ABN2SP46_9ACTN